MGVPQDVTFECRTLLDLERQDIVVLPEDMR